ncbi:MAG: hypothetical protein AAF658_12335 [Myxococcota bacterium]
MTDEEKQPPNVKDLTDLAFKEAVHGIGSVFNTRAFWIPGIIAGLLGIVGAWFLVPGEPPMRLVVGLSAFLVLWIGVGSLFSTLSRKRR